MADIPSGLKPNITGPSVHAPSMTGPSITKPTVSASGISAPSVSRPTMSRPTISRPTVSRPYLPRFHFFIPRIGPAFFTLSILLFLVLSFGVWWVLGVQRWQALSVNDDLLMFYVLYAPAATFLALFTGLIAFMIVRSVRRRLAERAERKKEALEAALAENEQALLSEEELIKQAYAQKIAYMVSAAVCCATESYGFHHEEEAADWAKTFVEKNNEYEVDQQLADIIENPPLCRWMPLPQIEDEEDFAELLMTQREEGVLSNREQRLLHLLLSAAEQQIATFRMQKMPFEKLLWKVVLQLPALDSEQSDVLLATLKAYLLDAGIAEEKLSVGWVPASADDTMRQVYRIIDQEASDHAPFVWLLSADSWHDYDYIEEQSLMIELPLVLGEAATSMVFASNQTLQQFRVEPWVTLCRPSSLLPQDDAMDDENQDDESSVAAVQSADHSADANANADAENKPKPFGEIVSESIYNANTSLKDVAHIVSSLSFIGEASFKISQFVLDQELPLDPVKDHVMIEATVGDVGASKHNFSLILSAALASQDEEKMIVCVDNFGQYANIVKHSNFEMPVAEDYDPDALQWVNKLKPTEQASDHLELEQEVASAT